MTPFTSPHICASTLGHHLLPFPVTNLLVPDQQITGWYRCKSTHFLFAKACSSGVILPHLPQPHLHPRGYKPKSCWIVKTSACNICLCLIRLESFKSENLPFKDIMCGKTAMWSCSHLTYSFFSSSSLSSWPSAVITTSTLEGC